MKGYYGDRRDRFASLEKRDFRSALIRLLETEYKLVGSHRVLQSLADDIEQLQQAYFPKQDRVEAGTIAWITTAKTERKPSYGKRTEDYESVMIYLPLVTREDIDKRIFVKAGTKNNNYIINRDRDVASMIRLVKSAWDQGGMLSQAELAVLLNRGLSSIRRYLAEYEAKHPDEALPLKGYVLDQGSRPTHKGIIITLYEQGVDPPEIARRTKHGLDAVDRYIKAYEQVKGLHRNGLDKEAIKGVTGKSLRLVETYLTIMKHFHPEKEKPDGQLADPVKKN